MKKLLLFTMTIVFSTACLAQDKPVRSSSEISISKKNVPKKVRSALYKEYGMAVNISWTKRNGNYIATFNVGQRRQTATYRADGTRIYTRRVETSMPL